MVYDLGDTVSVGVQIRNAAEVLVTPSTITLVITQPDGTAMAATTPSTAATGIYTFDAVPTQAGRHLVRWTTTGPATAHTDMFDVAEAAPPLIVGIAEAKAYLNIPATETTDDDELRSFIEALTAPVEKICGAVVRRTRTSILRSHANTGLYCNALPLPYSPVVSVTSATLVRDASSVDITGWYVDGAVLYASIYGWFPPEPFTLTYVVGRPDLPANIRLGALYVLKLAWRSQRGNNPDSFMPFLVANAAAEWFAGDEQMLGFA